MHSTFFCLGKFLKWLANDESSSITKESSYYISYMYIQPFSMEVDWREIWHQMDVSTMFYICRYCVFTLWGRDMETTFGSPFKLASDNTKHKTSSLKFTSLLSCLKIWWLEAKFMHTDVYKVTGHHMKWNIWHEGQTTSHKSQLHSDSFREFNKQDEDMTSTRSVRLSESIFCIFCFKHPVNSDA